MESDSKRKEEMLTRSLTTEQMSLAEQDLFLPKFPQVHFKWVGISSRGIEREKKRKANPTVQVTVHFHIVVLI